MRFSLADEKKANPKEIGQLDSVKGTFTNGTFIWPLIALSNMAQSGAVFATYFIYKQDKSAYL